MRTDCDAPSAPQAVGRAINVGVTMAEERDDTQDLARAGRSALTAGNALTQLEADKRRAVMSWERQVESTALGILSR